MYEKQIFFVATDAVLITLKTLDSLKRILEALQCLVFLNKVYMRLLATAYLLNQKVQVYYRKHEKKCYGLWLLHISLTKTVTFNSASKIY